MLSTEIQYTVGGTSTATPDWGKIGIDKILDVMGELKPPYFRFEHSVHPSEALVVPASMTKNGRRCVMLNPKHQEAVETWQKDHPETLPPE